MIVVHHLEYSRSQRILWMLEELELDYHVEVWHRDPNTMLAPADLKRVHPLGKAPILVDGDRVLAESGAIIEYLADRYGDGRMRPSDPDLLDQYRFWLHYAEGSAMPPLLLRLVFSQLGGKRAPLVLRPLLGAIGRQVDRTFISSQIRTHFGFIDAHLAEREWFVGDAISGADIQMSFPLEAAVTRSPEARDWPNIRAYVERIRSRDAYQRAARKGGGFGVPA